MLKTVYFRIHKEHCLLLQDHDHDGRISFADFKKSVMGENLLLNAFGVCLPDTMVITKQQLLKTTYISENRSV